MYASKYAAHADPPSGPASPGESVLPPHAAPTARASPNRPTRIDSGYTSRGRPFSANGAAIGENIRGMPKVVLRLRDLQSGESAVHELPSVDEAIAWLVVRPSMTEVVGVVFEGLSREENDRMRAAVRPLDEAERARAAALEAAADAEREKRARTERMKVTSAQMRFLQHVNGRRTIRQIADRVAKSGESPGASKLKKAEDLGIPQLDAASFQSLLDTGELPA